jgi:hypothetical protein
MRFRYLVGLTMLTGLVLAGWAPAQPGRNSSRRGGTADETAPRGPVSWEYKVLGRNQVEGLAPKDSQNHLTDGLNQLGAEGWELAATETQGPIPSNFVYLFKRPTGSSRRAEAAAPAAQPEAKREAKPDEFRIYRLKGASAVELAQTLQKLFQGREEKAVRIVADPNTNSLLTAGTAEQQDTVRTLIEQLDMPGDARAEPKRK